jgi:hypothetical protein
MEFRCNISSKEKYKKDEMALPSFKGGLLKKTAIANEN